MRARPKGVPRGRISRLSGLARTGLAGALLLAIAAVTSPLPAAATTRSATVLDAGSAASEPSGQRVVLASVRDADGAAAVAPRPSEPRASSAAFALGPPLRAETPPRGVVATDAAACERCGGRVARWCVAHATSTQVP